MHTTSHVAGWQATSLVVCLLGLALGVLAKIEPFALSDVRLLDTSHQIRYERLNAKYLLEMLDPDRLLWSFRKTAGLPTPGQPYIASWEDPGCELRGHFVGHYLSALSLAYASTGNIAFHTRLALMVSELGKVQQALGLGGYLSAFPSEFFDRVEALKPVWAPYYTIPIAPFPDTTQIHKIIAGLVDAYELGGQKEALAMASRMVAYHWNRTQALIASKGREHWNGVLNCEFGGMNEILYRMHRITKDPTHLEFARLFEKPFFMKPMVNNFDILESLHANTHLAQVAGFAEAYDTVGDEAARNATRNFFDIVTTHHSFATGGSNDHEFWQAPDRMADSVIKQKDAVETQETCTQYNILKIARSLFRWTGNVAYADFYERALLNGILGTARLPPEDWPERALPHRHGEDAHHHHHHHVNHLRRSLVTLSSGPGQHSASGSDAGAAKTEAGEEGVLVSPHRRPHNEQWLPWWAFAKPQPEWNASDAHGPGVFLYLTPLGTGQSKSDNIHHWGFPYHSFWCCYGTVVESHAKLADSIYFKDMNPQQGGPSDPSAPKLPPRLYINQLVPSKVTWHELGLRITTEADMFAPGPAATAQIRFDPLSAAAAGSQLSAMFTLMVRVPEWAAREAASGTAGRGRGISIGVNGQSWTSCPGAPVPGSYCQVTRQWSTGDVVSLRLPMRWWLKPLPENRPQYSGLQAVMMGPFVMAGITHNDRLLRLPGSSSAAAASASLGTSTGSPVNLGGRVYLPEEADELLSLQAAWNASLHVRHDANLLYMSALEDGGDAMDATFRLGRGCHHGGRTDSGFTSSVSEHHNLLSLLHGQSHRQDISTDVPSHGALSDAFTSLRSLMRLGQHDAGQQLSLEAMAYPNHYIAYDHSDVIVLQPGAAGSKAASCNRAMWMMRPGLDGAPDTVSFEAVARPGYYLTAVGFDGKASDVAASCRDAPKETCQEGGSDSSCTSDSFAPVAATEVMLAATAAVVVVEEEDLAGPHVNVLVRRPVAASAAAEIQTEAAKPAAENRPHHRYRPGGGGFGGSKTIPRCRDGAGTSVPLSLPPPPPAASCMADSVGICCPPSPPRVDASRECSGILRTTSCTDSIVRTAPFGHSCHRLRVSGATPSMSGKASPSSWRQCSVVARPLSPPPLVLVKGLMLGQRRWARETPLE
ncbi:hypothetical protein VOLCADRAFT_106211 [Volvox carteri f. nagariensis]|uniref:Uncharacterized protein n=1 Tax=Volvox carteri f. nagariensis TaxID=3068 RepID=D8U5V1_VOLCA|nr:uncharacterized protein VOLCADRAFT_106211 [Volvox carteri f. nagariensis]EFJ44751.1 hypothetical protein VOLCADRAFT_106211 [Volvox carteri f. nagariensis]|eukprot:XP_002954034.1 hypothetical protein VOLCADRAFT_106211 [Volvox carteri f. nagariensis]